MGLLEAKVENIQLIISQIRNEISLTRFFELGADFDILRKFESYFEKIAGLFQELEKVFDPKPFGEKKTYFDSMRVVHETQIFLKEIRRKQEGNVENTQKFLEYIHQLEELLPALLSQNTASQKKSESIENQSSLLLNGDTRRNALAEENSASPHPLEPLNINTANTKSFIFRLLPIVFVGFPRVIGRVILDISGRGKDSADSTFIVLGYTLIIFTGLVVWGFVDINSLRDWFTGSWRFFFPVK